MRRIAGEEMPDPCNADRELAKIIKKACAFKPTDRYQTAEELREKLENVLASPQQDMGTSILNPQAGTENGEESETVPITFSVEPTWDPSEGKSSFGGNKNAESNKNQGSLKDKSKKTDGKTKRHNSIPVKTVFALIALLCVLVVISMAIIFLPRSDSEKEFVSNACAKDISGILYQMEIRFRKDVMEDARVYELSAGSYGYVIQTRNEGEVKYSFFLPRADREMKEKVTDETGVYEKSLQSGVLYLMRGMNISEPAVTDTNESVVINNQDLTLSKITLYDYPEISEGYPAVAYLITDDKKCIRRIMLLTSDGFLVRSDYTYDSEDRIIKSHWTKVWMDKEQWQKLGWYSSETNSMTVSPADIDQYVKRMIVMLPKDFVKASPSGKNADSNATYAYDENGFLKEFDYKNAQKHIVWEFTYDGKLRREGVREWTDGSSSKIQKNYFVYERNKEGFVVKVNYDEGFWGNDETVEDEFSSAVGFEYTYNDDGTMNIEVVD